MLLQVHRTLYSELDDLDYQIAVYLQENARLPYTTIAKELGVTEKTIRTRVQHMQEQGVLSLVGVVNPVKAGIRVETIIFIATYENKLDEVVEILHELSEVRLMVLTSGEYQLMIQVFSRDNDELSDFLLKKLNTITGIRKTNVIVELKVLKSKLKFIR